MKILRAVIIEDEQSGREVLKSALQKYVKGVDVVGEADNVESGANIIRVKKPNLVFLDIELHSKTGFDVLEKCRDYEFKVIFVTAHDEFAIKAIRYSAFDYLLKPLDINDLKASIERIRHLDVDQHQNIHFLKRQLKKTNIGTDQLIIPSNQGYKFIQLSELLALKAEGGYVFFILEGGQKLLAAKSIGYYEDLLPADVFFRIHKSHIINLTKIKTIDSGRTGYVHLISGATFSIAARRKSKLIRHYNVSMKRSSGLR